MNHGKNSPPIKEFSEETEDKNTISIDEFFKQLEAKERDLDISSEMVIEIDEADFNREYVPGFLKTGASADDAEKFQKAKTEEKSNKETHSKLENTVPTLQKQISKMEAERVELVEISRRRQSDFANYKKRIERERNETFLNQISNLATQMLPVLDNFNRALDSASNSAGEKVSDSENFFNGILLVNQQLNEVLSEMGVEPIVSVGELFDPHLHEAVATEETDDIPPHMITEELMRGYRIGERVIRHSMVKVSAKKEELKRDEI